MKKYEPISNMFSKFTEIINALNTLGKIYTNHELICKILRFLPKEWEAKVIVIQEAKNLTKLFLNELVGSLMTHELNMAQKEEEEESKKKTIAFKSTVNFEGSNESKEDEKKESEDDDEDIILLSKKFKKFLMKKDLKKKEDEKRR